MYGLGKCCGSQLNFTLLIQCASDESQLKLPPMKINGSEKGFNSQLSLRLIIRGAFHDSEHITNYDNAWFREMLCLNLTQFNTDNTMCI